MLKQLQNKDRETNEIQDRYLNQFNEIKEQNNKNLSSYIEKQIYQLISKKKLLSNSINISN